jgi:hypothetical protein
VIVKKQSLISCSRIDKGKSNSTQTKHKTYEIETKSNTPRAQGGKGLLSHSISVQVLKNPLLARERRGRENSERGRKRQGEERMAYVLSKPGKKREREGEGVFNPNNSQPKRLNYP